MAGIELFTRTTKKTLDKVVEGERQNQLYETLFPDEDNIDQAGVQIDEYTEQPESMRVVEQGEGAIPVSYDVASGEIFVPLESSEMRGIDQKLMDSVQGGEEPTASAKRQVANYTKRMLFGPNGFYNRSKMQKNKAAIDLLRTGQFTRTNKNGVSKSLNYNRPASLDLTPDFSTDSFDDACNEALEALQEQGCPTNNIGVILGKSWMKEFKTDTEVKDRLQIYNGAFQNLIPETFKNTEGLKIIGRYTPNESLIDCVIMGFQPQYLHRLNGGAGEPFIPDDEAVFFSMDSMNTRVNCGVDVANRKTGKIERLTGSDIVITDSLQDNPPVQWIIARNRYLFILNVRHTARSTGSNF